MKKKKTKEGFFSPLAKKGAKKPPFAMVDWNGRKIQPGGHSIARPPSTWKCRCGTLC